MPLPTACCAAATASPVASSPSRPRASHLLFAFRRLRKNREPVEAAARFVKVYSSKAVSFGKVQKSIKCCVAKGHNSTVTSNEASNGHLPGSSNPQRLVAVRFCPNDRDGKTNLKSNSSLLRQGRDVHCRSYGPRNTSETKECKSPENGNDPYRDFEERQRGKSQFSDNQVTGQKKSLYSSNGLSKACQFAYNDAKFVNERAQNDIILLSRGIRRLNKRASQDVAVLGLGFLKLDARARKDTQKIDNSVKERAAHLTNFARILKERAQSDLKKAADQHWSDGALEADLRRADMVVRRRAMEDAFMALKFVRDIHDMMANKLQDQLPANGSFSPTNSTRFITLEKNGKNLELFPHEVSTDQIAAIEEAYLSMASALSEVDGIDYTDPDELELLVAALIDLDAMDGKKSVSLIAECSSSPDVNTRKALANALAAAPSMWTLGNAGMGALQRLAQDSNYAVSRSASRAIDELRKQWELEEGDSLRFVMNQKSALEETDDNDSAADNITT